MVEEKYILPFGISPLASVCVPALLVSIRVRDLQPATILAGGAELRLSRAGRESRLVVDYAISVPEPLKRSTPSYISRCSTSSNCSNPASAHHPTATRTCLVGDDRSAYSVVRMKDRQVVRPSRKGDAESQSASLFGGCCLTIVPQAILRRGLPAAHPAIAMRQAR